MEETWKEFREKVLKVKESRNHKIRNSYGVYDAYKYYRKTKPKDSKYILTESQYFSIIRKINLRLAKSLIEGKDVILPNRMGTLEIRKRDQIIRFEGKKLVTNMPIDWEKTLKLWYEDSEAYTNKTLVRENMQEIYSVYYNKSRALYKNKLFYKFSPNREISKQIMAKAKGKLIESYSIF